MDMPSLLAVLVILSPRFARLDQDTKDTNHEEEDYTDIFIVSRTGGDSPDDGTSNDAVCLSAGGMFGRK